MALGVRVKAGLVAILLAASVVATAQTSGAARGGNHGCNPSTGTFFSDHFWPDGDRVTVGFFQHEETFPPSTSDNVTAANPGTTGSPNQVTCGAEEGSWSLFTSDLGPGKDRARTDGAGLQPVLRGGKAAEVKPLPRSIRTRIDGGGGRDRIVGRKGVDKLIGGSGNDVIKAADGGPADKIRCGSGNNDKAVVDAKDDTAGCERLVVR